MENVLSTYVCFALLYFPGASLAFSGRYIRGARHDRARQGKAALFDIRDRGRDE